MFSSVRTIGYIIIYIHRRCFKHNSYTKHLLIVMFCVLQGQKGVVTTTCEEWRCHSFANPTNIITSSSRYLYCVFWTAVKATAKVSPTIPVYLRPLLPTTLPFESKFLFAQVPRPPQHTCCSRRAGWSSDLTGTAFSRMRKAIRHVPNCQSFTINEIPNISYLNPL